MTKTIVITGATDGIGLELAATLHADGHRVALHGRNPTKLASAAERLSNASSHPPPETYAADLSDLSEAKSLAAQIRARHERIDVLINNAGVYKTSAPLAANGMDVRFVVNTLSPYILMQELLPALGPDARVVNLSSAAQAPVDEAALSGERRLTDDFDAYAQSKLALTMWSRRRGLELAGKGLLIVAVNPGSLLATKMVKQGFGVAGNDMGIGVDILMRAALSEEFSSAAGKYYDNDSRQFADPHPDALNDTLVNTVMRAITNAIA